MKSKNKGAPLDCKIFEECNKCRNRAVKKYSVLSDDELELHKFSLQVKIEDCVFRAERSGSISKVFFPFLIFIFGLLIGYVNSQEVLKEFQFWVGCFIWVAIFLAIIGLAAYYIVGEFSLGDYIKKEEAVYRLELKVIEELIKKR